MRKFIFGLLLAIGPPGVGLAQAPYFDPAALQLNCLRGSCVTTVRSTLETLQALQLPLPEFHSQLAVIAAVLFDTARNGDAEVTRQVSQALVILAGYSSDENQIRSLIWVAGEIANGRGGLFDVDDPFAVSPS